MSQEQPNDPLHGVTLEQVVTKLEAHYGWDELGSRINIRCFTHDPSIKSSLKFLRKTQWARDKVEALYIRTFSNKNATRSKGKPKDGSNKKTTNADIWNK